MTKPIAIILGEPNSISSEIIFKSWIKKKKFRHPPCFVIGNYNLLYRHLKYFKFNLKLKLIEINPRYWQQNSLADFSIVVDSNFNSDEDKELYEKLSIINVDYVKLVAPTNDEAYVLDALSRSGSWIYVVSYSGTTGTKKYNLDFINNSIKLIKKNYHTKMCATEDDTSTIHIGPQLRTEYDLT